MSDMGRWKAGGRAILNRPNFRSGLRTALLLPVLVWEVLREKDYDDYGGAWKGENRVSGPLRVHRGLLHSD